MPTRGRLGFSGIMETQIVTFAWEAQQPSPRLFKKLVIGDIGWQGTTDKRQGDFGAFVLWLPLAAIAVVDFRHVGLLLPATATIRNRHEAHFYRTSGFASGLARARFSRHSPCSPSRDSGNPARNH